MHKLSVLIVSLILLLAHTATAAPNLINYQGTLTDNVGMPIDGLISIEFRLFDVEPTGTGTQLWAETQNVTVQNGTYNVLLGSATSFPGDLFNTDTLWLEVVAASEVLSPRQQMVSAPFAMQAQTVPDGSITNVKIADSTITAAKIIQGPGSGLDAETVGGQTLVDLDLRYSGQNTSPFQLLPFTNATRFELEIGSDGFPVVAYTTLNGLYLLHCKNTQCENSSLILLDKNTSKTFTDFDFTIAGDGSPIVNYVTLDPGNGDTVLKVAKCSDAECSSSNVSSIIFATGSFPELSLHEPAIATNTTGIPIITYSAGPSINLIACGNNTCSTNNMIRQLATGSSPDTIHSNGAVAVGNDNLPVISYNTHDLNNNVQDQLIVAKCLEESCTRITNNIIAETSTPNAKITLNLDSSGNPIIYHYNTHFYCQDVTCSDYLKFEDIQIGNNSATWITDPSGPFHVTYNQIAKCKDQGCSDFLFVDWPEPTSGSTVVEGLNGLPLVLYQKATFNAGEGDLVLYFCENEECSEQKANTASYSENCQKKYWGRDVDGDGYSTPPQIETCGDQPFGYDEVTVETDCDDGSSSINPGAIDEGCDGIDSNCDGLDCYTIDNDGDGADYTLDCDDHNALAYPGNIETCGNRIDDDCDGIIDCLDEDKDADGFPYSIDCNDGVSSVYPGAPEICGNGIDDDCDSFTDNGCDLDGDGFIAEIDCHDGDGSIYPGAPEICDGILNNCDGSISPAEFDNDGDGYVECVIDVSGWNGPPTILDGGDCNNNDINIYPGATEICDGQNNNCDAITDEGCACDYNSDPDGVCSSGLINASTGLCDPPGSFEITETTIDDGLDNDCDGIADEGGICNYNGDPDGVCATGTINAGNGLCDQPVGYEATEALCDGIDNDCDGLVDEVCPSIIFSEYSDTNGGHDGIEIYNTSAQIFNPSVCQLEIYLNGSGAPGPIIPLPSTPLTPGDTLVMCLFNFSPACQYINGALQWSGNDTLALNCPDGFKDSIGQIGTLPPNTQYWGVFPTTSSNAVIRRQCAVSVGDENPFNTYDPTAEWDGFPATDFSDLGQHCAPQQ